MTEDSAQDIERVRESLYNLYHFPKGLPSGRSEEHDEGRLALSRLESRLVDMRREVDRQLGRHLCYTSESARARFWGGVDRALAAAPEQPAWGPDHPSYDEMGQ